MTIKSKRIMIRLEEELYTRLMAESHRGGVPMAEMLRRGALLYLREHEPVTAARKKGERPTKQP